jgi:hypothetical protein
LEVVIIFSAMLAPPSNPRNGKAPSCPTSKLVVGDIAAIRVAAADEFMKQIKENKSILPEIATAAPLIEKPCE